MLSISRTCNAISFPCSHLTQKDIHFFFVLRGGEGVWGDALRGKSLLVSPLPSPRKGIMSCLDLRARVPRKLRVPGKAGSDRAWRVNDRLRLQLWNAGSWCGQDVACPGSTERLARSVQVLILLLSLSDNVCLPSLWPLHYPYFSILPTISCLLFPIIYWSSGCQTFSHFRCLSKYQQQRMFDPFCPVNTFHWFTKFVFYIRRTYTHSKGGNISTGVLLKICSR